MVDLSAQPVGVYPLLVDILFKVTGRRLQIGLECLAVLAQIVQQPDQLTMSGQAEFGGEAARPPCDTVKVSVERLPIVVAGTMVGGKLGNVGH